MPNVWHCFERKGKRQKGREWVLEGSRLIGGRSEAKGKRENVLAQ